MALNPTMELVGWVASKATEAVVDCLAGGVARKVKERAACNARKLVSEKRQLLSDRLAR